MNATDELRRLLDERGVEWEARTSPRGSIWTYWDAFNGHRVYAIDNENGTVKIFGEWDVTPAQAIDATLGRGECHNVHEPPKDETFWPAPHFKCSECGATHVSMEYVFHCPNCGRKVVDE